MAQPLLCSRLGVYSFVCPRCSASLRNNMSVSQKRGNAAAPIRFFNSGSESLHDATPPTRRHDAASVLLYPRSTGSTTRPTSATSYALSAAQSRITPRSHYSSSSTADGPSSSSSTGQSERPEPPDYLDEKEKAIFDRLNEALEPIALQVEDISGGCGSMYAVAITADKFKGLPVIKQHRLVNEVLGEDIKSWHGIQLRTKAP